MSKWYQIKAAAKGPAEIAIFDQIGVDDDTGQGVSAKAFDSELKALGSQPKILLRINSPGGDVMQGMAIYSMLQNSKAKITARIEGIAASAASLIAMAADRIEIHSNAFMLIHQPYTVASGNAEDLVTAAGDLERMTAQYVSIYAKKSGKSEDDVLSLMKEDRLMTADEAVAFGLCDAVIDPSTEKVNLKLVPKSFLAAVEAAVSKESSMALKPKKTLGLSADEIKAFRSLLAILAKADDSDDEDANARADADENDEEPTNAKKAKARKARADDSDDDSGDARADDENDMDARADDTDGDDDKPAAKGRKAKAKFDGLAYASDVSEICAIAHRDDLIAGFLADRTPLAEVRKRLVKARAETESHVSNIRSAATKVQAEEVAKGWEAAISKLKR